MILIDANLLIYAVDTMSPDHEAANTWLDEQCSGGTPIGLPWLVIVAFLRLTTNRRVVPSPFTPEQAIDRLQDWLTLPNVSMPEPGDNHWPTLQRLIIRSGTAGNLTNDAHLAAIAIERGAIMCSADNDFRRFEGLQFFNPLAPDGVREPTMAYATST